MCNRVVSTGQMEQSRAAPEYQSDEPRGAEMLSAARDLVQHEGRGETATAPPQASAAASMTIEASTRV